MEYKHADEIITELGIEKFNFYISNEFIELLGQNETVENKDQQIYDILNTKISQSELLKTFEKKIAIRYYESLNEELLTSLIKWFNKQCCKIENVVLVTVWNIGLKEWCADYSKLMNKRIFSILELPFTSIYIKDLIKNLDKNTKILSPIDPLEYIFDYYGGLAEPSPDKDYLVSLLLSEANFGFIDYKCGFTNDIGTFDNYLEQVTGFSNREFCDKLLDARKNCSFNSINANCNSKEIVGKDPYYNSNIGSKSFCNVIRETFIDQNLYVVTEKTLKVFLNFQVPLPIGFQGVDKLEKLGFHFLHNIVDYSYQNEVLWYNRSIKLVKELNRLYNTYSLTELAEIKYNNKDIFYHNYNHIVSGDLQKEILKNINL